jgi:hypothetical protein
MHSAQWLLILISMLYSVTAAAQAGGFYVYQPKGGVEVLTASCPGLQAPSPGKSAQVNCTFTNTPVTIKECAENKETCKGAKFLQSLEDPPSALIFGRGEIDGMSCCMVYNPACGCYMRRCPCPFGPSRDTK